MRAFVFTDASLERQAGRFVWLALDIENEKNASLESKLTIEGVPTLFVVDPRRETVLRRVLGSATAVQLNALLDEAYASWKGAAARRLLPGVGASPVRANLAAGGLDCALGLDKADPERKAAVAEFESLARDVLADATLPLAADDRSGLYGSLVGARDDEGDKEG